MNDEQVVKIYNLGYNAMQRIHAVTMLGHTTLKGHCVYVRTSEDDIMGHLFLGLNGDKGSYDRVVQYCQKETMDIYRVMQDRRFGGGWNGA